jgi:hypothetical protein
MANDFTNDKGEERLGKIRIEFADHASSRKRVTREASRPSREGSRCCALNLPIAWVRWNRSANM